MAHPFPALFPIIWNIFMTRIRVAILDHASLDHTWQSSKAEGDQLPNIMDHNIHISPGPPPLDFHVRGKKKTLLKPLLFWVFLSFSDKHHNSIPLMKINRNLLYADLPWSAFPFFLVSFLSNLLNVTSTKFNNSISPRAKISLKGVYSSTDRISAFSAKPPKPD